MSAEGHVWLKAQLAERKTEPNSGLGKAITYLLRHWKGLALFLREARAPLDNNLVERALKRAVLHRNWAGMRIRSACQAGGPRIHFVTAAGDNVVRGHPYIISETFQEPK